MPCDVMSCRSAPSPPKALTVPPVQELPDEASHLRHIDRRRERHAHREIQTDRHIERDKERSQ
jgi:hypothetical protein